MSDVTSLEDERSEREDTDPRIKLDRLQIEAQGKEIAALRLDFDKLFALVRKMAKKLGVRE